MTDREAMKLALEALEEAQWFTGYAASGMTHAGWVTNNAKKADAKTEEAITAIRQALEQPDPVEAAVLAEREACAKASEFQIERWADDRARYAAGECAAAIRQRMK